jgi:hypothetical protein
VSNCASEDVVGGRQFALQLESEPGFIQRVHRQGGGAHPVNQLPMLTRECENSEGENAGCDRNADGCARYPWSPIPNQRMAPTPAKTRSRCERVAFALESKAWENPEKLSTNKYNFLT